MKKLRLEHHDRIILSICVVVACASLYFLYDPSLLLTDSSQSKTEIGRIVQIDQDVRIKPVGSYFWDKAYSDAKITSGQSLFTGEDSKSEILFSDGRRLTISENSLVLFRVNNNEITLDFSFGEISAKDIKEKIKIVVCGKEYEIDPETATEFKLNRSKECDSLNVNVQKGQLKLNNKKLNPLVEYQEKPKLIAETPPVLEPVTQTTTESTGPTELNSPTEAAPPIEANQVPVVEEPKPELSPEPTAPQITLEAPELNTSALRHRTTSETKPKVKWSKVSGAERYEIEWSNSKNFAKSEKEIIESTEFEFKENPIRKVYFRTRALSSIADAGPFSKVGEITPTYPFIKITTAELSELYEAKNSMDKGPARKFDIEWSEIPNTAYYEIEVSRSEKFDRVAKVRSQTAKTSLNVPMTGDYYWRVSAFNKQGKVITQSQDFGVIKYSRLFDLETPDIPDRYRDASFFFQKTAARFIWISWSESKNPNAVYKVDVSATPDFTKILKSYESDRPTLLIREQFPEGMYYWRVRTEVESIVSDWSSTSKFRIMTGSKRGTANQ